MSPTDLDFRCRCGHFESDHFKLNPRRLQQARPCTQCFWCMHYVWEHEPPPEPILKEAWAWIRKKVKS